MSLTKKIFLVDDDPTCAFLAKKIIANITVITRIGTIVSEFCDGQKAIDFIKYNINYTEELPDIIFLDINMPVLDGWGFLEQFDVIKLQIKKEVKLYVVSSSVSPDDLMRAKEFSMVTDFIRKPIHTREIVEILSSISNT
ncbi:response regulator [Mucilaginibacter sp. FT3.2]|uniref:response regulator n=1 Tax=Mucilaginibacter sp. FT3.2 TaxID=2723090 RepID=UPI00161FDBCF|nr:response regulator [Mucilaginibacter sp. FT3.2]MBB6234961.1 CheY-like chemotaxis protein [Mucilaginibacter sp. FT3.2]